MGGNCGARCPFPLPTMVTWQRRCPTTGLLTSPFVVRTELHQRDRRGGNGLQERVRLGEKCGCQFAAGVSQERSQCRKGTCNRRQSQNHGGQGRGAVAAAASAAAAAPTAGSRAAGNTVAAPAAAAGADGPATAATTTTTGTGTGTRYVCHCARFRHCCARFIP